MAVNFRRSYLYLLSSEWEALNFAAASSFIEALQCSQPTICWKIFLFCKRCSHCFSYLDTHTQVVWVVVNQQNSFTLFMFLLELVNMYCCNCGTERTKRKPFIYTRTPPWRSLSVQHYIVCTPLLKIMW